MNKDPLTLVLNKISCCQNGQCCKVLSATVFLGITSPHYRPGVTLSLWTCLVFQAWLLWPQCSHLIAIFSTIRVAHTALFYLGKSVVVFLSGPPDKTEQHKCNLVAEISHYPSSLRSCLPSQKEKESIFVEQPDITRKSDRHTQDIPLSFLCTLLTQMESLLWWD